MESDDEDPDVDEDEDNEPPAEGTRMMSHVPTWKMLTLLLLSIKAHKSLKRQCEHSDSEPEVAVIKKPACTKRKLNTGWTLPFSLYQYCC